MFEDGTGNLLEADVDALVNTVNTEGVMGKGLALQFKRAFPENEKAYVKACRAGEVQVGRMFIVDRGLLARPRWIVNFPTKKHWRQPSQIEYIQDGLDDLVREIPRLNIKSIAMPPLGCGNGGLSWADVRPMISEALYRFDYLRVLMFAPTGTPQARTMPDKRDRSPLTADGAAMILGMHRYLTTGWEYELTMLEAQKVAYFLHHAGEFPKASFKANRFGPYDDGFRHMFERWEGHFTSGYGDGNVRALTAISLLPGAVEAAEKIVDDSMGQTPSRLARTMNLIAGFETPFGMELLATVHWVATHGKNPVPGLEEVVTGVHNWSSHKKKTMKPGHVKIALERLREHGWLEVPKATAAAGGSGEFPRTPA